MTSTGMPAACAPFNSIRVGARGNHLNDFRIQRARSDVVNERLQIRARTRKQKRRFSKVEFQILPGANKAALLGARNVSPPAALGALRETTCAHVRSSFQNETQPGEHMAKHQRSEAVAAAKGFPRNPGRQTRTTAHCGPSGPFQASRRTERTDRNRKRGQAFRPAPLLYSA